MEYVALDFETANNESGGACAIGLVRYDEDGRESGRYYSLIKPRVDYYDPWMSMVHHLKREDCNASPEFDVLWPTINDFIGGDLVVAHFAQFDMGVLRRALEVYGLSSDPITYVCTCNLARKIWPGLSSYKLSKMVEYLNLDEYRQHYALDDAVMCGRLFYKETSSHLMEREDLRDFLKGKGYQPKRLILPS